MELLSVQSPPCSLCPPHSLKISRLRSKRSNFLSGQQINPPSSRRATRKVRFIGLTPGIAPETGHGANSLNPRATGEFKSETSSKDRNLVFVAGATGKVGSRTVRELLKLGFRVRAGVRSTRRADSLVQSVKQMKLDAEIPPAERLDLVECDLEQESQIGPAIGNSSIVICCIGASEKEILDITGPYRIDYKATVNLIDAATDLKVDHFLLLTSLGTNKIGFPAAILNLFWGVLLWKRKAEEALFASGLPYTIVRPGGMERPTDSFKETHNLVLAGEDTYFGGLVSNLQVAELLAFMAKNRKLSFCKVVEVIAETTAPLTPTGDLLSTIPSQREDLSPPEEEIEEAPPKLEEMPPPKEIEEAPRKTEFLSPYAMYEDLKPPTSPTPTPSRTPDSENGAAPKIAVSASEELKPPASPEASAGGGESSVLSDPPPADEQPVKPVAPRPSSPYFMYEDLKPPSSPSPSSPVPAAPPAAAAVSPELSTTGGESSTTSEPPATVEQTIKPAAPRPSSPFAMYEDLKPPSSPSPSSPALAAAAVTPEASTAGESAVVSDLPLADEKAVELARPSSPFYMYEDLKPPASPTPSLPK